MQVKHEIQRAQQVWAIDNHLFSKHIHYEINF